MGILVYILGLLIAFFIITFVMKTSVHDSYEYIRDDSEENMQEPHSEHESDKK